MDRIVKPCKNIFQWIKNPDEIKMDLSIMEKFTLFSQILLLDVLFCIPFIGLTKFIHFYVVKLEYPLIDYNIVVIILLSVFAGPIIEELIFRLPLRYQRNYLAQVVNWFTRGWLKKEWSGFYKYFLYFSILTFGLAHVFNYENREFIFYLLSPIIIGSQLIGGFLLSYSRVKLGFIWSLLQHIVFNLLLLLLGLVFHNESITKIDDENLSLSINELMYIDKDDSFYLSTSKDNLIYSIEANDISIFRLIDSLQTNGSLPYDNVWIDVKMKSKDGITKEQLLSIIKEEIRFDN